MAIYIPSERSRPVTMARPRVPPCRRYRTRNPSPLPTEPGRYFWDAWNTYVDVYRKSRYKGLFVTPPCRGAVEIRITPYIAGTFQRCES